MNKREWLLQFVLGNPFYDMEDTVGAAAKLYDAIVAASPEPTDEGWIEHRGEKPYPEGMIDVRLRDGSQCLAESSDEWVWTHDPDAPEEDIIAWRPAT